MSRSRTSIEPDPRLRRRRRLRVFGLLLVVFIVIAAISDRTGLLGYAGDDFSRFNHRSFRVVDVVDGDTFHIMVDDRPIPVRLLGVDAPDPPSSHWSAESTRYTTARLKDRTITLRLDGTQTREADGHLLAYVFITDTDNLNADIVRDGQAYADRRVKHTFHSAFEQAENEARKKHRGMWKNLSDDMQPPWRQAWLRALRERRNNP
jgi:endonuclease YncB( thermonuclease family)